MLCHCKHLSVSTIHGKEGKGHDSVMCGVPDITWCVQTAIVLFTCHGFFLADVINIIALTVVGVEHPHHDGFTYGQAFWMIVVSTSVSSFVNVTLIVDLIRTRDFSESGI